MALRILIVEDEPEMADLLARGLRGEAYLVDVAENGHDPLTLAKDGGHDIAVLDVMFPGMSGFEVCRWLRRQNPGLAIILLTASRSSPASLRAQVERSSYRTSLASGYEWT